KPAGVLSVIKSGTPGENDVLAISGATITSNAVTLGVNAAIDVFNTKLK
ncbi:MAG: FMN-binding protein, partial [Filifactor alocis]|nr:FMN-binding protein [Filifactor alocis]